MTTENVQGNPPTYRIGAVSRLTGVPADTLRVWERRYTVVTPVRSDTGTRLYGPEDVGRLALIKRLVDRGDAISSVANLSLLQLRERFSGADLPEYRHEPQGPCRVAVLGAALGERLRLEESALEGLELMGIYERPEALLAATARDTPDLLLFDCPTVHSDQVREIGHLLVQSGAPRAILVYHFAGRGTLERLEARHILAKRAPVDAAELSRWCLALHQSDRAVAQRQSEASEGVDISLPIPPRRFAAGQLARIAAAAPTLRCECPHHLADLVSALAAFEGYCEECEARHADDAALHAFLHATTAHARALMEGALAHVVAAEGIEIGPVAVHLSVTDADLAEVRRRG